MVGYYGGSNHKANVYNDIVADTLLMGCAIDVIQMLQTSQGYIFRFSQPFATNPCKFGDARSR